MKYVSPVIAALLFTLSTPVFAAIENDMPWATGDLTLEDLSEDELAEANPELFYRAVNPKQQAEHAARKVQIVVHKSMKERGYQYLTVAVDGQVVHEAIVSTAFERMAKAKTRTYRAYTPVGQFFPDGMQEKRFSNTWQVWLKHVVMFQGGVWLHATTPDHFMELGAPASGGCVRLYPKDAAIIYEHVKAHGINQTAITVLPAAADEKQIPWTMQKNRAVPEDVVNFRTNENIK